MALAALESDMCKLKDLTGMRFGHLAVISMAEREPSQKLMWLCLCDCGKYHVVDGSNLRRGYVKSCGCFSQKDGLETRRLSAKPLDLNMTCPVCGKKFHLKPYAVKRSKTHYCSKSCQNEARKEYMKGQGNHQYGLRGELNDSWKGGRNLTQYGYIEVQCIGHPFAVGKEEYVLEHRLVAEKYFLTDENSIEINGQKYLKPEYVVHHKNHIRTDNRPENLEVMLKSKHSSIHSLESPRPRDEKTGRFIKSPS